ncbi:ferritin-like domain-containing protein [Dyella sp. C9]|uniref:ferritin-like domain-containing protein n=1 Tax=Dyella sp. C9 TaxID=2202154 RepID=UPI0018E58AD7|nr:ferritin-like domain-containing protein [Dyella sp. C9]
MASKIKAGSEEHKSLFCRQFVESYQDYDPETLPWPALDGADLARLRGVPFWQEVYHTERRAGAIVDAFTPHVADPVVREAIALQGFEERRHADLIRVMIERYGIDATAQPLEASSADLETAFIDFGFGECLDAFLGFGAFKSARQSQFLPAELFDIFDTLMFEETRHIVFFINYMAWREKQRGLGAVRRALKSARFYGRAGGRLMGMVKRGQEPNDGKDFAVTQANLFLEGFSFQGFVEDCYRENARRMSAFDPDLMQPRLLPGIARLALRGLKAWDTARAPFKKSAANPAAATQRDQA